MKWVYDDGGRAAAGYKGKTGDCVCRAVAIATGKSYKEVYDDINTLAKSERTGKRKKDVSSARNGVYKDTSRKLLEKYGWKWVATSKIGVGCTMHLTETEVPEGTIICKLAKHLVAVVNKEIHDTYNSSIKQYYDGDVLVTNDKRCVYGYYVKA